MNRSSLSRHLVLALTTAIAVPSLIVGCAAPASAQATGSAQAGTATTGPGRLVTPEDMRENERLYEQSLRDRKLFEGEATDDERREVERVMAGRDPRRMIANYTGAFGLPQGPPALSTGSLLFLPDESLRALFPNKLFFVLRFRQWPLAANLPPPLSSNNIFAVDSKGTVEMINARDRLTPFFQQNVHAVRDERSASLVATAWLLLAEELVQDGMFHFGKPVVTLVPSANLAVEGRVNVEPHGGNFGEITVGIKFVEGEIGSVEQCTDVKAGMRPVCQSTKLLDPDPIVRKMAEQDLLIMGKDAKPYLDEQKSKLSPEQQSAVDRIWQRILLEGR
jgi:hypothetical protein